MSEIELSMMEADAASAKVELNVAEHVRRLAAEVRRLSVPTTRRPTDAEAGAALRFVEVASQLEETTPPFDSVYLRALNVLDRYFA